MPRTKLNIRKRKKDRKEGRLRNGRKNSCTVSEAARQWLPVVALKVKPSTLAAYEAMVRLHICPQLGHMGFKQLSATEVSVFAQEKLKNGRTDGKGGLAPKTVCDILTVLKSIIDFAVGEGYIDNAIKVVYPKHQQKLMRVLSRAEQSALEHVLLENPTIYKTGILLCLYTGLRIGELCGLRWEDFSPDFEKLSIRRSVRRMSAGDGDKRTELTLNTPKTKASLREIPIPKFLSPMLGSFASGAGAYFLSTPERRMIEPRTMQNHFKRAVNEADIPSANFHCLRHTFSTRCIEADVDIKSLSEMLGHTSVNITLNRYACVKHGQPILFEYFLIPNCLPKTTHNTI
ncbi:MAG: site-specific integrase [Oscillospiraceae bacterium]|nr:site-specific integrase [Oscillospiraceae bacterium]